jgi:hypothetical protein
MWLVNLAKAAGKGKVVCRINILVSEENHAMVNQCLINRVLYGWSERLAKINTADFCPDMTCQFGNRHVRHLALPRLCVTPHL